MSKRAALVTTGVAAVLALAPVTTAQAAPRPAVDFSGQGSYSIGADGAARVTGSATGTPFRGSYTAVLRAQDGTLPEPGQCEPGTATVYLDGPGWNFLRQRASGDVCGQFVQPPYVVTQVFTGSYQVTSASRWNLRGTDGFLEIRLATDGRANLFAIDT